MTKYLAYIKQDNSGYVFLAAVKKFSGIKLQDRDSYESEGVYRLFEYGIKIMDDYYAYENKKIDNDSMYTFQINDDYLEYNELQILKDNKRDNEDGTTTFFGKRLTFKNNDERRISLKTLKSDNECSEVFVLKDNVNTEKIYDYLEKLPLDRKPITNSIYLTDKKTVIGPFSAVLNADDYNTYKLTPNGYADYMADVYKYETFIRDCTEVDIPNRGCYTLVCNSLFKSDKAPVPYEKMDCISTEALIASCQKFGINRTNMDSVSSEEIGFKFSKERKQRFFAVTETKRENEKQYTEFIKELFSKDETRQIIKKECPDYFNSNETDSDELRQIKDELQNKTNECSELKNQNLEHNNYISLLQEEIESIKDRNQKYSELENIDKECETKKKELEELRDDYNREKGKKEQVEEERFGKEKELENLKKEIKEITEEFGKQIGEKYKAAADAIETKINTTLLSKVLKSISEHQNKEEEKQLTPGIFDAAKGDKKYESVKELVKDIYNRFQNAKRLEFEENDIANILLCMSQGFLTVFAGEPGTGKTSFVKLLAKFLGLRDNNRYAEISVEKGWSTKRDLLGFFNPLTKEINKANKALYNGLRILDIEAKNKIFDFPYAVLLDEANLSPIEYYWADFMKFCDYYDKESDCKISISDDLDLIVPKTMRFFATINLDHTTEILSPRLVDRSWIIKLPFKELDLRDEFTYIPEDETYPLISYDIFDKINKVALDNSILSSNIDNIFADIKKAFRNANIFFSPRTVAMIQKYCIAAKKFELMDGSEPVALDYAVSQKILPLVNGQGKCYEKLVKDLTEISEKYEMEKCKNILDNISKNADKNALEYYGYFAR